VSFTATCTQRRSPLRNWPNSKRPCQSSRGATPVWLDSCERLFSSKLFQRGTWVLAVLMARRVEIEPFIVVLLTVWRAGAPTTKLNGKSRVNGSQAGDREMESKQSAIGETNE
jgi:hypothetical protein